jgi:hypothetical protein
MIYHGLITSLFVMLYRTVKHYNLGVIWACDFYNRIFYRTPMIRYLEFFDNGDSGWHSRKVETYQSV